MKINKNEMLRIEESSNPLNNNKVWEEIPPLIIEEYLWLKNGYQPKVEINALQKKSIVEKYGSDYWEVFYKISFSVLKNITA